MRSIAVCDDDEAQLKATLDLLGDFASSRQMELDVRSYAKTCDLLSELHDFNPDLVFMDIEFDGQPEGILAVHVINEQVPDCQVVYLTNYLQYAVDVYRTDHVWFVLKTQLEQRLPELFDKLSAIEASKRKHVVVETKDGAIINMACADIRYIERRERVTHIVTKDATYHVREKVSSLLERLPKGLFARCHYSFVVNMEHVSEIHASDLTLDDGTRLIVSRNYAKAFRERYLQWADSWTV